MNYKRNINKIVKIQAYYRGIKQKKVYQMMLLNKTQSKYFTEEEFKETI